MVNLEQKSFTNLLVIMTDRHIGNLLVSLYAIKSAHNLLKNDQSLTCIVDHQLLSLAQYLLPDIRFIPFSLRGRALSPLKKITTLFRLLVTLRKQSFDVAVDLYGHSESLWLAKWSQAKFISTYYCQPKLAQKYDWCNVDTTEQAVHQRDYYALPFYPLLGKLPSALLKAPTVNKTLKTTQKNLVELGININKPIVVIHPGAGKPYKFWPTSHWQTLIKKLEHSGQQVLLIGAGVDLEQVNAILTDTEINAFNGHQKFNLIETIHLGFIANIMIGNDSGPTHLMATTQTQVFSLFGPTDHNLWAPLSNNSMILHAGVSCSNSCTKNQCQRDISCLQALTPDQVFNAVSTKTND
jgi:ADP-heptose:LPS heptosyltransferase